MSIHIKWTVLVACLICNTARAEPGPTDPQAYARCLVAFGPVYGVLCRKTDAGVRQTVLIRGFDQPQFQTGPTGVRVQQGPKLPPL